MSIRQFSHAFSASILALALSATPVNAVPAEAFYLQAGAFSQVNNAKHFAKTLETVTQHQASIAPIPKAGKRLYLVQLDNLPNQEMAKQLQQRLADKHIKTELRTSISKPSYIQNLDSGIIKTSSIDPTLPAPAPKRIPSRVIRAQKLQKQQTTPSTKPVSKPVSNSTTTNNNKTAEKRLWNLAQVDIRSVVAEVSRVTGKNFIIDPRVQGKVSIVSSTPMGPDEIYQVFLSVLQVSGFAAIPTKNNMIKIVPSLDGRTLATKVANRFEPGHGDENVVRVLPVKFVPAMQLVPILRPLMPEWSNVTAYTPSNMLILAGRADNIKRIAAIVKRVDIASHNGVNMIRLRHATASDVVKTIKSLQSEGEGAEKINIAADDRSNSVLISGNKAVRLRLRVVISDLDSRSPRDNRNTQVIHVQYLRARDLVPILAGVARSQFSGQVGTIIGTRTTEASINLDPNEKSGQLQNPAINLVRQAQSSTTATTTEIKGTGGKAGVEIIAEPNTNTLILNAPPSIMRNLRAVVQRLDRRPVQIAVQAMIVEINEDAINELGIQWGTTADGASDSTFENGFAIIREKGGLDDLQARIKALTTTNKANILSTPTVVVLNNHLAHIKVGRQFSVDTTTYPGNANGTAIANPYTTVARQDAALVLNVTPQVTQGKAITLNIGQQNNSSEDPTDKSGRPVFDIAEISTSVIVNSGNVLVLGGLIKNTLQRDDQEIPIIGKIPIVGRLFQDNKRRIQKQKLMVFIRPMILHNSTESNQYSNNRYDLTRRMQLRQILEYGHRSDPQNHVLPAMTHIKLPEPFTP